MAIFPRITVNAGKDGFTPDLNEGATAIRRSSPRSITASGRQLNLSKARDRDMLRNRVYSEWQNEAWAYYDAIGEIKYGFLMLASVMSRIRLYAALDVDQDSAPTSIVAYRSRQEDAEGNEHNRDEKKGLKAPSYITEEVMQYAEKLVSDLTNGTGSHSELIRRYSVNTSVAGECYLIYHDDEWQIRSNNEILASVDGKVYIRQVRAMTNHDASMSSPTTDDEPLEEGAYVGRIWRSHARYLTEPDSSMLSIRESCDELLVIQRMIRAIARSRMNAGLLYLPDGLTVAGSSLAEDVADEEEQMDELLQDLYDSMTDPIEDESSPASVVPLVVTGPEGFGKEISYITMSRESDQWLVDRADRALERIMQGLDMPKDFVTGLANLKYTNAQSIDAALYKSHVEPNIVMLCDTLNSMYFKPAILAKFPELKDKDLSKLCMWYDPSEVVTSVDPSQAAKEGYDNYALSADVWRKSHGFSDTDAPSEEEVALRFLLNKATLQPDQVSALFTAAFPNLLKKHRTEVVENSENPMPESARRMLYPEQYENEAETPSQSDELPTDDNYAYPSERETRRSPTGTGSGYNTGTMNGVSDLGTHRSTSRSGDRYA